MTSTHQDTAATAVTAPVAVTAVAGVFLGTRSERDAEHHGVELAETLMAQSIPVPWLSTHRTTGEGGVAVVSVALAAPVEPEALHAALVAAARSELSDGHDIAVWAAAAGATADAGDDALDVRTAAARQAATALDGRTEGRAVWFPGQDALGERVAATDLLAVTAVEDLVSLEGGPVAPGTTVVTRGFVRPRFVGGRAVLHLQPAVGGTLVPFESPNPTPCCADHA